ncbi:MAG TPA: UDP-N-acetylmuramate--L-alanine ligase [Acidimicrobiales bacterium]|nr:UDP-N-acetylmuramate--L-alanine ligase [Acidimicrobiales bacterium]
MGERATFRMPDLSAPRRVHVVGIGGAGMSAIAAVLAEMGHKVTGSDLAGGRVLSHLESLGIEVHVGHVPEVAAAADMLAVSSAIPGEDPEVIEASRRSIEVWPRSAVLAAICALRRTAAVSGTHGKTTTSSMLAVILREAGWRPSMIIGGDIAGIGPGSVWEPSGDWIVVEADESDETFIRLGAEAVAVTSIGSDHLDHYGSREQLDLAFARFLSEATGPAVVCLDDPGAARVAAGLAPRAGSDRRTPITYGRAEQADVRIDGVELLGDAATFFVTERGSRRGPVSLSVPGEHNVLDATAAIALAVSIGVPWEQAIAGVGAYRGVARRYETRGSAGGVTFIDDYAHNPEKVAAALATARCGTWGRVVAVFQPHRYSRTEALWSEFGPALSDADILIVTDVYPAGERPRPGITGRLIADAVSASRPEAVVHYVETLAEAESLLREELRPGDLCLTLGAGDITDLAARFLGERGERDG